MLLSKYCSEHDGNIHVWTDKCAKKEAIHISGNSISKVGEISMPAEKFKF